MKAAITIDVDSLRFYREIHGLESRSESGDPIYDVAIGRFFDLLEAARVPATMFLVGNDAPRYAERFARAGALGVEIASHSFAHDYRLTTRGADAIRDDLERAHRALLPLSPRGEIVGFRAPGYNTSPELMAAVKALGYRYDSSLLPSPLYFGARALAISAYRALGRPSRSIVGSLFAFSGRLDPYRANLERPWEEDPNGLLELPMACEPLTRVPLFGTAWVLAGSRSRRVMLRSALRRLPYLNFEMHAIDLLDGTDEVGELPKSQRDLRVSVREKMTAFRELFEQLRDTCDLSTLADLSSVC